MSAFHVPVMLEEVLKGLHIEPGGKYIDATVGGGGHGIEIVKRGGVLLGIDADREAVEYAVENAKLGREYKIIQGNFKDIDKIAMSEGFSEVSGILFDLGVSSHQLDTPERGFSYRFTDAPLDLRLDQTKGVTAAQLVNRVSEEELYDIFARFSEEELARPIAHALFRACAVKSVESTGDLVAVVETVVKEQKKRNAVLSRVFQALRIAVNEELTSLRMGLEGAEKLVRKNGRLVVITFHSLEDRIVKQFMRQGEWNVVTKKPIVAGLEEQARNRRARSAKLRVAEKI